MNITQLQEKFSQGVNWNGFLYIIHKVLFFSLSLLLYNKLTIRDFSTWANTNNIIFLFLLWIDLGFRKSLPRYCPAFAQNKKSMKQFIRYIIGFKTVLLLFATPIFFVIAQYLSNTLHLVQNRTFLYLGCTLFFIEGIIAIVRLIFHSYFWQKQFNLLSLIIVTMQMGTIITLVGFTQVSTTVLHSIFIIKCVSGVLVIGISLFMLKQLYKDTSYAHNKKINTRDLTMAFAQHSGIMWINNNLKSITERNFLVPLFTYTLGPQQANLFKIANDGALLFQRTVLKTIGTTDTSLLAHIETLPNTQTLLPRIFKQLTTKIISISVPLVAIIFFLLYWRGFTTTENSQLPFYLFALFTLCYLIQAMLTPYERVLEVKRKYTKLMISYLPYIMMAIFFIVFDLIPSIGLLGSIIIVHTVRLVSSFLMIYFARKQFQLQFPVRFALLTFSWSCAAVTALYILFTCIFFPLSPWISSFYYHLRSLIP